MFGIEYDAHVPACASAWEYFKYCASDDLPTHIMEAQLDYFGSHRFTSRSESEEERDKVAKKGTQHLVWKDPY